MFIILLCVKTTEDTYSYYPYNYGTFVNALTNYDNLQRQTTGNESYASYWIKLFDAETGVVIKEEERDLNAIRA